MYVIYDDKPVEESTALLSLTLKDEEGNVVVPKTLKWSLSDAEGNIINNRDEVDVSAPASTTKILLYGEDLALIDESDDGFRIITIQATYDSDNGTDLPFIDQIGFYIEKVSAITL
ncbi:hypothetical protein DRN93_01445 [archaeon]|nr:MAG: hypothetical protein DRN93_01445 [archaeon]